MDISSLGWDLAELESAAQLVVEEERPCTAAEHQNTSVNPLRAGDNHTPPTGDTTPFSGSMSHDSEEGLDEDLARRMTLRSPQEACCLIEEISSSQTEGSSEDSSESEDSKSETSSESEESLESEDPSEDPSEENSFDSSNQSPPLQPTAATNQECVESGKGIIQTVPHPSVLPSEQYSITN